MKYFILAILFLAGCGKDLPPPPPAGPGLSSESKPASVTSEIAVTAERQKYVPIAQDVPRNPFLLDQESAAIQDQTRQVLEGSTLTAVLTGPQKSYAVIDGRIVRPNDLLYGKQVIRIERERVILKDISGEYVVNLIR